eukprot:g7088.t1
MNTIINMISEHLRIVGLPEHTLAIPSPLCKSTQSPRDTELVWSQEKPLNENYSAWFFPCYEAEKQCWWLQWLPHPIPISTPQTNRLMTPFEQLVLPLNQPDDTSLSTIDSLVLVFLHQRTGHRIEVPYQYFVTGAYVNLLFQHTVQRLQAEGPSIPLRSSPSSSLSSSIDASESSPIGVFGGFLSSSGSSPSIADVSSSPPTVIVVFISSHVPTFLSTCVVCSLGPRSRRITDNEPVWSSPPSLGITEAKSARIPAIVDACPP